jgi:phosphoglycolate phosphatase
MDGEYEAYVYDLDGTLVRLNVDWDEVAREVAEVLRQEGVFAQGRNLWKLLERAEEENCREPVEETIAEYELQGVRNGERLELAAVLPHDEPVGVCSLNCSEACTVALEFFELNEAVDVVVGRDSVPTEKPHPEPLLATIDALKASVEQTLFIGDSERDEETAERAGTSFVYASEWYNQVG